MPTSHIRGALSMPYRLSLTRAGHSVLLLHVICNHVKPGEPMGRYFRNYDAMGEPISILPIRAEAQVSDGAVQARIEKQVYDVCALEDSFDLDDVKGIDDNVHRE